MMILDGCRPDALAQAKTPNLDALWQSGAYTWTGRSVMPSVTLPAHNSMFRSIPPAKHGVREDNIFRQSALAFPSVLDVAKQAGLHTAMFYSWEQLRDLSSPGSLNMSYCRNAIYGEDNDSLIAAQAAAYITAEQPDFCVLYLGDIDISGHAFGWMSPEYIEAIEANDRAVGEVVTALEKTSLRDQYVILVLADHGGHEFGHGEDIPEDMTIPWFLSGPGVKQNHNIQTPVGLLDTAPTIAHILGLEHQTLWEGQPIYDAFA
jgi:predicted AlkP superfamily pyrophosphatase or phosphodiesterase